MTQISSRAAEDDRGYDRLLDMIHARFRARMGAAPRVPLFTTDADLNGAYLAAFPEADRQYHTCHACRRFLENYGGLVTIDEVGRIESPIWPSEDVPDHYAAPIAAIRELVLRAKVTGVFFSSDPLWGVADNPKKGGAGIWTHFNLQAPRSALLESRLHTAGQVMAEKREDRATLLRGLAEFTSEHLETAVKILGADALYRGERILGPARWLLDLHRLRASVAVKAARENVVWLAVATAPAGFCHPRSSMIGTLLEDIAEGLDLDAVAKRFAAKMHPLRYQRPQAAPSAGNIEQAEAVVSKLGIASALRRRFARIEDLSPLWVPATPQAAPPRGSVFGHLREQTRSPLEMPGASLTWEKFVRTALPGAQRIELHAPFHGYYGAFVTAVDPEAPPILQWDREDLRNPVSVYTYSSGSPASRWGLSTGWVRVTAIAYRPHQWNGETRSAHQTNGLMFVLEGARDSSCSSLALFPETLRSELHSVRATIEAFSRSGTLEGIEEASACGLLADEKGKWESVRLRVFDADGDSRVYTLDRWD